MSQDKRAFSFENWQLSKSQSGDPSITHKPLCILTYLAVSCRIFYLVIIDLPETHNASWLAVAIGALLASPVLLSAYLLMRKHGPRLDRGAQKALGKPVSRACMAIFALALAYDASAVFVALTGSATYASLYNAPTWLLLVPTALACTLSASRGGNAAGGCAGIWLRIVPFLYVLVLIWQYKSANPAWLAPILGPGLRALLRAGWLCATYFCMIPVAFLCGEGVTVYGPNDTREARPASILYVFLFCALTVTALCAVHDCMYPNIPTMSESRSIQLDLLVSNGKSNRSIQLPMLLIWFGSLAVTAVFMLYCAGRLAARAFNRRDTRLTLALGALALASALLGFAKQNNVIRFAQYAVFPFGAYFLAACALSLILKKGSVRK